MDAVKPLIDAMLRADLDAPRKQRHTARRVLARLVDEHGAAVSYSSVADYVAKARVRIAAEAGRAAGDGFVPQTHEPGAEAEVDFGDLWIDLHGVRTKVHLFTFRLSFSGKAVHRVFGNQAQEAFLEGHLYAFDVFGSVPVERIRYDNLTVAVAKVLFGRDRTESARWITFRLRYRFDAFYCQPGPDGAHEKGGVEGEIGRFRRNHLVPVPKVENLVELNERLTAADEADDARRIANRLNSVGVDFAFESSVVEPAAPGQVRDRDLAHSTGGPILADHRCQCHYSDPARFIGHRVHAVLRASELIVAERAKAIARRERATTRGAQVLTLDHYLEVLTRKPGALPGATALVQARAAGKFTPAHEAFWAAARRPRVIPVGPGP